MSSSNFSEVRFKKHYGLLGKHILLSVGRLIARKGIADFLRFSYPHILQKHPESVFVIIGEEARSALKKDKYVLEEIKDAIVEKNLINHVLLLGRVEEPILQAAYREADLFIFPGKEIAGDVEGFGMVTVEAAAQGLPVVAFAVGGVTDAVSHMHSGFLIPPGDYRLFEKTVSEYLSNKIANITKEHCRNFAKQFSWQRYGRQLRELCRKIMQSQASD